MALYESTFIARPDISAQDADKLAGDFTAIIKENGGKVVKKEYWGLRNLAYKINKASKGHYIWLGINAPAEAVKELERKYKIHEDILRSLTLRVEKLPEGQTAMLKAGNSDNDNEERE